MIIKASNQNHNYNHEGDLRQWYKRFASLYMDTEIHLFVPKRSQTPALSLNLENLVKYSAVLLCVSGAEESGGQQQSSVNFCHQEHQHLMPGT